MIRRPRTSRSRGLSLIEVMVCVIIAAILSAMVIASLRTSKGKMSLPEALAKLAAQDRLMRDRASRFRQPGQLSFDPRTGTVLRFETTPGGKKQRIVIFPGGDGPRVEQLRVLGESRQDDGSHRVTCLALGRTASYAALVSAGGQRQWVLVSGLTGEFAKVDDESQVQNIFDQPTSGRNAR